MTLAPHRHATASDWLPMWADTQGDKIAFRVLDDRGDAEAGALTYAELDARARRVAGALDGARGERALLMFASGLDFIVAFFGCLYAGVLPVPVVPPRRGKLRQSVAAIAASARPRFVFAPEGGADEIAPQLAAAATARWLSVDRCADARPASPWTPRPEDIAFLQYTSGSTSAPKGVMVSHANLRANFEFLRRATGATNATVHATWLPLFHDMGLVWNVLEPVFLGASAVLMAPLTFVQRPLAWLRAIGRYGVGVSGGPNFAFDLLVKHFREEHARGLDLSSWHFCYNAAEPLRAATVDAFLAIYERFGLSPAALKGGYGMAEATLMISAGPREHRAPTTAASRSGLARRRLEAPLTDADAARLVSSGLPDDGERVVIVDPDRRSPLGPQEVGEIWVSGPHVAQGYLGDPAATEQTFGARTIDGEGPFLRTGDLGFLRDGFVYVAGRLKDVMIVRGQNYYPQDIEKTAEEAHPALRPAFSTAFLVGDDARLVVAVEVDRDAAPALAAEEIVGAIRAAVVAEHDLLVGDAVLLKHGALVKTSSGKVQRTLMRDLYLAGRLDRWEPSAAHPPAVPVAH